MIKYSSVERAYEIQEEIRILKKSIPCIKNRFDRDNLKLRTYFTNLKLAAYLGQELDISYFGEDFVRLLKSAFESKIKELEAELLEIGVDLNG